MCGLAAGCGRRRGSRPHLQEDDGLEVAVARPQARRPTPSTTPIVEGVTCHFTVPEKGGWTGWLGLAEELSNASLACRQVGPIKFKRKFEQGDESLQPAPLPLLQEDADRARLRRQAQRAGLHDVYTDKIIEGSPENSTSSRTDHAVGHQRTETLLGVDQIAGRNLFIGGRERGDSQSEALMAQRGAKARCSLRSLAASAEKPVADDAAPRSKLAAALSSRAGIGGPPLNRLFGVDATND